MCIRDRENPGSIFALGAAGAIASGIGAGEFKSNNYQAKNPGGSGGNTSVSFADSYNMDLGDGFGSSSFMDYSPSINWEM